MLPTKLDESDKKDSVWKYSKDCETLINSKIAKANVKTKDPRLILATQCVVEKILNPISGEEI